MRHWRGRVRDDKWTGLVFRAVAVTNDDGRLPLLQEIYRSMKDDDRRLSEFYWTIRIMDGPEALKFRKKIRDEVGMDRLR